jgi:hydroxyacyl-ACP dehydratase HTD2-like protein with hotdog domain
MTTNDRSGELQQGMSLPELVRAPGAIDIFRFSAVTWNAHRIHYDLEQARAEGFTGVVVQAHLHGAYLAQTVARIGTPRARLRRLAWRNRVAVIAGESITCGGEVLEVRKTDGRTFVESSLHERNAAGVVTVEGSATLEIAET